MFQNKTKIFCFIVAFVFIITGMFLFWYFFIHNNLSRKECFIHINKDTTQQHPLLLNINTNQFYLPNEKDGLKFKHGDKILLSCPGNNNHLIVNNITEIHATCVNNKTFQVNEINYNFKQLQCMHHPEITAKYSGKNCSSIYQQIHVGFHTGRGFLTLYTNCFNRFKMDTLYSQFNLTTKIKTFQYSKRPRFKSLHFYKNLTTDPSILYTRKHQQQRFEKLLGTSKHISLKSDFFLARGHLTAKADFVYASQQRATFLYINVAPQWQTFNGKSWMELENSVRHFVANKTNDLIVYTGVFGVAKLPDTNGTLVNLTLFNNNKTDVLTVPQFFWKIIHDPVSNNGIVFIGHNNPYETDVNRYCIDICDKINWVSWHRNNITTGLSYCCDYQEFKTIVKYAPQLPINGILI